MTKNGEINPASTPDTENRLTEKAAAGDKRAQTRRLDDDPAKRLSDRAAQSLKK